MVAENFNRKKPVNLEAVTFNVDVFKHLQMNVVGGKIVLRYCNNGGPEGCGLGTLFGIYGTICQCNTELCNHSPAIRNSHVNIWFAITWVTFKFLF